MGARRARTWSMRAAASTREVTPEQQHAGREVLDEPALAREQGAAKREIAPR
jgi:hypothetical protein